MFGLYYIHQMNDARAARTIVGAPKPQPAPKPIFLNLVRGEGKEVTLREMRAMAGNHIVHQVAVTRLGAEEHCAGSLQIVFTIQEGGLNSRLETYRTDFCSLGTLAQCLRQWRNLEGAPLFYGGVRAGKVSYRNSVLVELAK